MKNWFVLNTKPKKEAQVEKLFFEGGFTTYFPKHQIDNRIKPFFPGYAFIFFDFPSQYQMVKYTRGIKKLVGNGERPTPLPESVIENIRQREISGFIELEKHGIMPEAGDEIEVMEGAMKGLRGVFKNELSGNDRVMILLDFVSYQGKLIIEKKKIKKII